jgi:hypothetical protein
MSSEILMSIGTPRSPIVVQLSEYEGRRTLDIRRYFHGPDGELLPTRKGIALNRETVGIFRNLLESEAKRIDEWLDPLDSQSNEARDLERKRLALDAAKFGARDHTIAQSEWRNASFFHVRYDGHADILTLNRGQQVGRLLADPVLTNSCFLLQQLLRLILITYSRSRSLFSGVGTIDAEALLDELEFNWGIILDRYLQKSEA